MKRAAIAALDTVLLVVWVGLVYAMLWIVLDI